MNSKLLFLVLCCAFSSVLQAQQTVGIFQNEEAAYDGYTLFTPNLSNETYLINNCGEEVHSWSSSYPPGLSVYLLENGDLLRAGDNDSPNFTSGGGGGIIEKFDWDGNILWSYTYSTPNYRQHHDIEPLPNGNILMIAWERKTSTQAIAWGRNPSAVGGQLWPLHIIEVEQTGPTTGNIVWEWHLWDHVVQDHDASKPNFGVVADHPELVDLNYFLASLFGGAPSDWIHANALDYNATLDQIVISSRSLEEIWIIDHSTTTAEAASHSGGNSGKGGDILYRYGNPAVYDRGTSADQKSWHQHNVQWIDDGLTDAGKLMFFNNGDGRPGGNHSSVDVLTPPMDGSGNYLAPAAGQPYGPTSLDWTYNEGPGGFYGDIMSGAQRLPNGNTLVCTATPGRVFEVDPAGNRVWEYENPVNWGPINQGSSPVLNWLFRAERYAPDYPAFDGRDLTPSGPIEPGTIFYACSLYPADECPPPDALSSTIFSSTQVQLSWSAEPSDVKYQIQGQKIGTPGVAYKVTSSNIANIPGLDPGASYTWRVRRQCGNGASSDFSEFDNFTMPLLSNGAASNLVWTLSSGQTAIDVSGSEINTIQLSDLSGRVLETAFTENGQATLNKGDLAAGLYVVRVTSNEEIDSRMIFHAGN